MYKDRDEQAVIAEAEQLFALADQDGSGEIDYSEWAVATINKRAILSDERLKEAFSLFDKVI
jgi:Ca2+-binding EF-hand superfamily protein